MTQNEKEFFLNRFLKSPCTLVMLYIIICEVIGQDMAGTDNAMCSSLLGATKYYTNQILIKGVPVLEIDSVHVFPIIAR